MDQVRKPFIVWKAYQRRVEAFVEALEIEPIYLHYHWEEKSKLHKLFSYLVKLTETVRALVRRKPSFFYIQAPPTFLLYASYLYCRITGARFAVDAHNSMIGPSLWSKMPLVQYLLKRTAVVIVHNREMAELAAAQGLPHTVLMDRPPRVAESYPYPREILGETGRPRVVVPCSYDIDEPLDEMQKATLLLPEVDFFITWYSEKLPPEYVRGFGPNTVFTGFLPQDEFDALLAHADAVLVLTTRDGTQPSGATEALAFHKPLVVSGLGIIREMFPKGAVYIENDASGIAAGIRDALKKKEQLTSEMTRFKEEKLRLWNQQFRELSRVISC